MTEAEALAGRDGRRGPCEEEEDEERGRRGRFLSIVSFYIVLAQTLCAHNPLQEQKNNQSG